MAVTAAWYGKAMLSILNKEVDLDTDTLKVMLCTSTYTPNQDTHQYKSDVTNEVSGTGYTATGLAARPDQVVITSPSRLASIRVTPPGADAPYGGAALIPIGSGPLALVLVREEGPEFHRSELWRVGQVGQIIGTVLAPV